MSDKPRVGDKLYVVCLKQKDRSYWCKVSKVGRKYFYITAETIPEWMEVRFNVDSWIEDYEIGSPTYCLYKSEAEYEECVLSARARAKVRGIFNSYSPANVTNEQIFAIADILNIELKKGDN